MHPAANKEKPIGGFDQVFIDVRHSEGLDQLTLPLNDILNDIKNHLVVKIYHRCNIIEFDKFALDLVGYDHHLK
jgi:hypothetical protein